MVESKHLRVGSLVEIKKSASHITEKRFTVLELMDQGIVVIQAEKKNAPVKFFPWVQVEFIEITPADKVQSSVTRTAGMMKAADLRS